MEFSYSIPIPSPDVSRPVPRLPGQLPSISPAGASTAQKASQQRQQLLIAGLGALASLLTVVATSVSITGMYSTVHRQRSLVRKLHGWSGLYMFRQVIAWETGLWDTLAIVIAWRSVTSWQAGRTESIAEEGDPMTCCPGLTPHRGLGQARQAWESRL